MTKAEIEAQWQAQLDAHNAKPDDEPRTVYRCRRCGGTFERKPSATPPKCCPACYFKGWLDPKAKIPPLRWKMKRKTGGNR